jgi:hypothetical protein
LKIAGGFHNTLPVYVKIAFVNVVTTYSPSALEKEKKRREAELK